MRACRAGFVKREIMAEKTSYFYRIEPQCVDFTLNATIEAMGSYLLNTAGTDAQRKGFGVDVLSKENRAWVLSRMAIELDYRPEQYTDIEVRTWVNENGRVLSTRNFEVADKAGEIFCRAVSQWCLIDYAKRVPVGLSEIKDMCHYMCDAPSPCDTPHKILDVEPAEFTEHKVVYSDIDFNCHVNTMRYIVMMIDMLPIDLLRENRPLRLDIHFIHESRLGQTLTVGYVQRGETSLFEIKTDDGTVACRASVEWR